MNNFVDNNVDNSIRSSNVDFVIMMDQSSGHRRMRKGALNTNLMSVKFGGKQSKMRNTVIRDIGTYEQKLEVGETQVMSFLEDDEGPFYLSPQERIRRKYDQPTGKIKRIAKSKKQWIQELKETKGFSVSRRYSKDEIYEISLDKNVLLTYNQEDVKEG